MPSSIKEVANLEEKTIRLGTDIFNEIRDTRISLFDPERYTGKLINWSMEDEDFRVSLLRFVDVLPSLQSGSEVMRHVHEYFSPVAGRIPGLVNWGLNLNPESLAAKTTATLVKRQVRAMAERFILGESPQKALKSLRKIRQQKMAFTVDLLGEAAVSELESERYLERYLELIEVLQKEVPRWKESQSLHPGHPGESTPNNVSVKLSALYSQAKPVNHEKTVAVLSKRLGQILRKAREADCFVNVDMESTAFTSITLETFKRVLSSEEFHDFDQAGIVLQAYLRRTDEDARDLLEWVEKRGVPISVRLVKGAYWDTETIRAKLDNWPIPVWQEKSASDIQFEKTSKLLIDHNDLIRPAFGSHNIRSLCHALTYAESRGLDKTAFEIQTLYGMADPIKKAFIDRGYLVREYAPIGELIPGMSYLVRRLLENTSNQGFIRIGFHENEDIGKLLQKPEAKTSDTGSEHLAHDPKKEFRNSPLRDFSIESSRADLLAALERIRERLLSKPMEVFPIIGGEKESCTQIWNTFSPEDNAFLLGKVGMASPKQAEDALKALADFFPKWRGVPPDERAEVLYKTAQILEERRSGLTALMILETGKPWAEADADVAEGIDFLNYYALQAIELFKTRETNSLPGEDDFYFYEPRGVCAVIGPWNFSLAIPCGMFAAALVTGNCPVLKPAEQSSLIAWELFRAFQEGGLPTGAGAFLPGYGEIVGPVLVNSALMSTIAFTGSKPVGMEIISSASRLQPGQTHVKRVIAEMGGKNAIIVDSDADLDEAVKGVVASAFSYAGQKCSACSRVIVLETVYEKFLSRLTEAARSLVTGPSSDPATVVGPAIDREAFERLKKAISDASEDCRLVVQGELPENADGGYFVPPTVFAEVPDGHNLLKNELFGPVLAVIKAPDFDSALKMAMQTEYALTGAVFSRSPNHLKQAARDYRVGNLYLNHGSTGALVGRQPFGGAHHSGVGSKAGGPDYLLQFVIPRTICENTLRQGFAPMDL